MRERLESGCRYANLKITNGSLPQHDGIISLFFAGKGPATFFGSYHIYCLMKMVKLDPCEERWLSLQENPSVQANAMWNQQAKTPASFANTGFLVLHTFLF